MKSIAKKIIISILSHRTRKILKSSDCRVIMILGEGEQRRLYKDTITDYLKNKNLEVVDSLPGYNHSLGATLTVEQKKAGGNSVFEWLKIIFSPIEKLPGEILILEYSYSGDKRDGMFIKDIIKPDIIVVSDDASAKKIPGCLHTESHYIIPEDASLTCPDVVRYGGSIECGLELVASRESEEGMYFEYQHEHEMYSVSMKHFGAMYMMPLMIADYLFYKISKNGTTVSSEKTKN